MSNKKIPLLFRTLNKCAHIGNFHRLKRSSLDIHYLHDTVSETIGLTDFGHSYYYEGLLQLLQSFSKIKSSHFIGRMILQKIIKTFLSNRLLLQNKINTNQKLFQQRIIPPIIVLGLPRTGTTFLHRMLTLDTEHNGIPLWKLMRPIPHHTIGNRERKAYWEFYLQSKLLPNIDKIHYSRSHTDEECIVLLGNTFISDIFWVSAPVYEFQNWLKYCDRKKAYEEYYQYLQLIQQENITKRLVLKAPSHTYALRTLMNTIPEALVIQTHRNPLTVLKSVNSLIHESHKKTVYIQDTQKTAEMNLTMCSDAVFQSMKWRAENQNKICDIHYENIISDPIATVKHIYQHFNLPYTEEYDINLKQFIHANPKNKFGKHSYTHQVLPQNYENTRKLFTDYANKYNISLEE